MPDPLTLHSRPPPTHLEEHMSDRIRLVPFTDADLPPGVVVCDVAEIAPAEGGLVVRETDIPEEDQ